MKELLTAMKELTSDSDLEGSEEYRRGQLDLVAYLFGVYGMPTDERMDELADELGWPHVF